MLFKHHYKSSPLNSTLCYVIPTKWRSYRDHRVCDVTSPYVYCIEDTAAAPAATTAAAAVRSVTQSSAAAARVDHDVVELPDVVVAAALFVEQVHRTQAGGDAARQGH